MTTIEEGEKIYFDVDYEDPYVQPLILAALKSHLPQELVIYLTSPHSIPPPNVRLVQWRQYEKIDFERLLQHSETSLANSYVIRKALIRKHYLSTTISHWLTKHPDSLLKRHVKPSIEFEIDYAEFLDDALVEAWELKEVWAQNEGKPPQEREWWILKPGMSERGQGIRLFSSENELREIFEAWDPPDDDETQDEVDEANLNGDLGDRAPTDRTGFTPSDRENGPLSTRDNGIITSQLRHFLAQPYIHPPLLLHQPHPCAGRKFHIRTYVLAIGALRVYVYKPMLALFAAKDYEAPHLSRSGDPNQDLLRHLTNTCLQSESGKLERQGHVQAFWSLPSNIPQLSSATNGHWRETVFEQICALTAETFRAAAQISSVHFQPLPNAFEIFGLDFLIDAKGEAWLLEVNAFPDFAQTGDELQGLVRGLIEEVIKVAIVPSFGTRREGEGQDGKGEEMVMVLDLDMGRR